MIETRLREQCGKDNKKFKTLKDLADGIGISYNMLYMVSLREKSLSLKSFYKLVLATGVSSNYYLGITDVKTFPSSNSNVKIPFNYALNLDFIDSELIDQFYKVIEGIKKFDSKIEKKENMQLEFVESKKENNRIFNGERLKVVMEATGYSSAGLAQALNCEKTTVDGWINKNMIPNIKKFEKLIYLLQCSGDFLLNLSNNPNIQWKPENQIVKIQGISTSGTKYIYENYGKHLKGSNDD